MFVLFAKYHALGNDFLVLEKSQLRLSGRRITRLARTICDRRSGVGADGILLLGSDTKTDGRVDVYNADGGWAEISGNGLRIAAVHLARKRSVSNRLVLRTGSGIWEVRLVRRIASGYIVRTQLGEPDFLARRVPVRTGRKYLINGPLRLGPVSLPVTCLSVGNPHTVLLVDNFDFEWQELGAEIEVAAAFPEGTNVEFVKTISRRKIKVAGWERGAGATGSSGTGAAAAVCAMVMLGLADRRCIVEFETGVLSVNWKTKSNMIELTGPARYVMEGTFEYR